MFVSLVFQLLSISNFFLNIYILFVLLFFGFFEIASEGFVIISLVNIFTHGLSGNLRNIYLGSKSYFNLKNIIVFRITVGIMGIVITTLITYFIIGKANIFFHIFFIILTVSNWIFELLIARNEKNNLINKFHVINIISLILLFPIIILLFSVNSTIIIIALYLVLKLLAYNKFFKNIFILDSLNKKGVFINLNLGTLSTLLKTISNFIWRLSALLFIGKSKSAILFMGFSLGSFYGTMFDISYGASFIKNKIKNKNYFLNVFFIIYVLCIFLFIIIYKKFSNFNITQYELLFTTTMISVMGAYLSIFALQSRQGYYEKPSLHNICYKIDIITYIFNSIIISALYSVGANYLILAYLISCIFLYFMYNVTIKYAISKNNK